MSAAGDSLIDALRDAAGSDNVLAEAADRFPYGYDNSRRHATPRAVVFCSTHDQVQGVVRACAAQGAPVVARGRGSGTTGGCVPLGGAVTLSLERMDRIVAMDPPNRAARAQPGVLNQRLQEEASRHGLFWPPDPSSASFCTIGGNLAFNGAGPRAVKYGTPRENTLGLTAVTGAGDTIRTGVYTTKGVVGYDLTRLLIGSEGTLAIITEATLKLTPLPEDRRTLQAVYDSMGAATEAVARIMTQPVTPCALEFIDGAAIDVIRSYSSATLPRGAGAMLMIEVDGPRAAMEAAVDGVSAAARGAGLISLSAAADAQEAAALWATRKALSPALRKLAPNKLNEDVVVPVSQMPALISGLEALSREHGIPIVNFGHAGNGNIHVNLLYNTQDPGQAQAARPCLEAVFELVLKLGGTLSGEHGVGVEKRDYVAREIDPVTLDLMQRIKREFDPHGILNPGKLFPSS